MDYCLDCSAVRGVVQHDKDCQYFGKFDNLKPEGQDEIVQVKDPNIPLTVNVREGFHKDILACVDLLEMPYESFIDLLLINHKTLINIYIDRIYYQIKSLEPGTELHVSEILGPTLYHVLSIPLRVYLQRRLIHIINEEKIHLTFGQKDNYYRKLSGRCIRFPKGLKQKKK